MENISHEDSEPLSAPASANSASPSTLPNQGEKTKINATSPTARKEMKISASVTVTDFSGKPYKNGKCRKKPWRVRFFSNGKPRTKFFRTRDEAEAYAKEQRQLLNRGLDPEDFRQAVLLAKGTRFRLVELVQMAILAIKANGTVGIDPSLTFKDGAAMVIARAERRKRREITLRSYKASYAALNKAFGDKPIALVDRPFVQKHIDSLKNAAGDGPASSSTRRIAVTNIRMVLAIAGVVTPLRGVETDNGEALPIKFYSNEQVRQILSATPDEHRGAVALMLFGAIRPHTMERLKAEDVNVEERKISTKAWQNKDRIPHLISAHAYLGSGQMSPGTPEVLWEWLKRYPFKPTAWKPLQEILKDALGFWIPDGLRHTAATNYCALWGVVATAELLTHKGTKLVKRHYAGATWKKPAEEFMGISPDQIPSKPHATEAEQKKIHWPSDEELSRLLFAHTRREVAKTIGCSVTALARRCRTRKIPRPSKGHWTPKPGENAVVEDAPVLGSHAA